MMVSTRPRLVACSELRASEVTWSHPLALFNPNFIFFIFLITTARPCGRCIKRGLEDTCQDGKRKKAKYLQDYADEGELRYDLDCGC